MVRADHPNIRLEVGPMRRLVVAIPVLLVTLLLTVHPAAQSKPTLKPADYDQFESVSPGAGRGGLSPDGKWFAYTITKVGGDSELRIAVSWAARRPKTMPFAIRRAVRAELEVDRLQHRRSRTRRPSGCAPRGSRCSASLACSIWRRTHESIVDGIESFAFDRTGQSWR